MPYADLINIDEFNEWSGASEFHDIYTVQLGELVEAGLFDWSKDYLNWKKYAYSTAQYKQLCEYFINRFYYREISIIPVKEWFMALKNKLCFELMPKYSPLYEAAETGYNPLADSDEYYKERHISSDYPETLLSKNSDYLSSGEDKEYERITLGNIADKENSYISSFVSIDKAICDELENMFVCLYTANVNGL